MTISLTDGKEYKNPTDCQQTTGDTHVVTAWDTDKQGNRTGEMVEVAGNYYRVKQYLKGVAGKQVKTFNFTTIRKWNYHQYS